MKKLLLLGVCLMTLLSFVSAEGYTEGAPVKAINLIGFESDHLVDWGCVDPHDPWVKGGGDEGASIFKALDISGSPSDGGSSETKMLADWA